MDNFICHHGVIGMKWGVRRYQNKDGSLTSIGKSRQRAIRSAKTKKDMDTLYNKLSDKEKLLMADKEKRKEWLTINEGEHVVKRFIQRYGKTPVAALDIFQESPNKAFVSVMTDPKYRGKGYASKLVKRGINWYNKNKAKLGLKRFVWGAYPENKASIALAQKAGFKYNKKKSSKEWSVLDYK